ncbi:MAG: ribosome biosis GTPase YlqF, partial [Clostridia bacterium]|nr:ribosome biosis GTPase YlqF [Clostridia bacterium]
PGVTRGKQWISLSDGIDLLDTPGILWPRLDDQESAVKLAITGAIKDDVLDLEALAIRLLSILVISYPEQLKTRYKLNDLPEDMHELLKLIGKKRGFIISGGEIDTERTSIVLLDEFRACKIGNISLELL